MEHLCVRVLFFSLEWTAARSGAHTAAKTMLEDMLTIRAETKQQSKAANKQDEGIILYTGSAGSVLVAEDRDRYYYGVNDIFRPQYSKELTVTVSMRRDQERCILVALTKNRPKRA